MGARGTEQPKLKIPCCPSNDNEGSHYEYNYLEEKLVSEYTGLNFFQIENLEVFEYWAILRDAVIYTYSQTEAGQEYLEKCWILEQTSPDRNKLRARFGKEVENG